MKLRSLGVALLISAAQAQEDFELARAVQQNLKWIRPPDLVDGMPPLDMAHFFSERQAYSPDISSHPRKLSRQIEPPMPEHIRDQHELEAFGMRYGRGREPNRWDMEYGPHDGRHSFEERSEWYDDPYRSHHDYRRWHDDYWWDEPEEDDWWDEEEARRHRLRDKFVDGPRYHWQNLAEEEPSKFEDSLLASLFAKENARKKKVSQPYFDLNARERDYKVEERGFFPAAFKAGENP